MVVAAGASSDHIKGVVSLSPQTYGAGMAGQVAPRKLLVAHGKADTRLPFSCALQIYEWAKEPKEVVLFEGAEHRLEECRDELGNPSLGVDTGNPGRRYRDSGPSVAGMGNDWRSQSKR